MQTRLLSMLAIVVAFQTAGCDAIQNLTGSKATKESKDKDKEKDDDDDDDDGAKKKKKKKDPDAESSGTADAKAPPPPVDAPALIDGPPVDKTKIAAFLKDDKAKLPPAIFEHALLNMADCRIDTHGVDYQCDAYKDYQKALGHSSEDYKKNAEIALKFTRHKSAAVRIESVKRAYSFGSSDRDEAVEKLLLTGRSDSEPLVVAAVVDVMAFKAKDKKEIREFIFASLEHKDDRVRDRAASALSMRSNYPIEGAYEKLAERVEKDGTKKVQGTACRALGATEDPRALDVMKKVLEADGDDEVRGSCFEGLIRLWVGYSYPKKPSKDAYELTMKILETKPRSKTTPPSRISELGSARTEFKSYDRSGKDWLKNADFFKQDRLFKVLEDIALDSDAQESVRSSALYALKSSGGKKLLTDIAGKLKTKKDSGSKYLVKTAERLSKEKDT